jgi:hypothetical protein
LACAESLSKIAAHRQASADFWQLPQVSETALKYYKYRDAADFLEHADCPRGAEACFDGSARSWLPVHYHELAHAWVRDGFDVYTRFASEGIATALSCTPFSRTPLESVPVSAALGLDSSLNFHAAARLVMGLLARGSASDLIAWSERVDDAEDPGAEAASAALDLYGQSLDEIWRDANREMALPCFALGRCDAPALPMGKTRMKTSCTGVTDFILSRDLGPAIGVTIVGAPPEIVACSPTAATYAPSVAGFGDQAGTSDTEYILETPAQPHLFTYPTADPTLEALLTARALSAAFDSACSLKNPLQLTARETKIILPERSDTLHFPLTVGAGVLATTLAGADVSGVSLAWCERCDACEPLSSDTTTSPSGTGVLKVTLERATTSRILSLRMSTP